MFEKLTERLSTAARRLSGQVRLNESNIQDSLREVRMALLEADVALPVVKALINQVREQAIGRQVHKSLTPGQTLVKLVQDELVNIMGAANEALTLNVAPPAVVLVAGLQGAGKTTTVAKLAHFLQQQHKKVMTVSCDVYRPAAIAQLQTLTAQVGAAFHPASEKDQPTAIAQQAIQQAKIAAADVLLVDTAGRLHIDEAMMTEIKRLHGICQPAETLFVIDSMSGQDAVNTAAAFNKALPLSGIILTKTDGDARGGAALSARYITGKPIKFLGSGEKTTALEPFHPQRIASRILGMGDVVSLVEQVEQKIDRAEATQLAKKIRKGKTFNLADLRSQLQQMLNMGGMAALLDKLPGMGQMAGAAKTQMDERQLRRTIAIINSMTPKERRLPTLINGARRKRIAKGAGASIQQVNQVMKQHKQMAKMMKKMGKGGNMLKQLRGMGGSNLPF